jgi:hypothetical protein
LEEGVVGDSFVIAVENGSVAARLNY